MKKSSNLFVSTAIAKTPYLAVMLLTLTQFVPLANAYPGNREQYDCYRKNDNQFSFGSPTDVSNRTTLCTPNPNYQSGTRSLTQRSTSATSNTSRKAYRNNYTRRDDTGARIAIGLGEFAVGALLGSALWPWDWGRGGWGGWGGYDGDAYFDNSISNIDIGDLGDLDASIQDIDLTETDASGDEIGIDESGDNFNTMEDMNDGDFGGDDFGGDDFGGDDFGGDDFGGDDFGGDDFGGDDFGGDDF